MCGVIKWLCDRKICLVCFIVVIVILVLLDYFGREIKRVSNLNNEYIYNNNNNNNNIMEVLDNSCCLGIGADPETLVVFRCWFMYPMR